MLTETKEKLLAVAGGGSESRASSAAAAPVPVPVVIVLPGTTGGRCARRLPPPLDPLHAARRTACISCLKNIAVYLMRIHHIHVPLYRDTR